MITTSNGVELKTKATEELLIHRLQNGITANSESDNFFSTDGQLYTLSLVDGKLFAKEAVIEFQEKFSRDLPAGYSAAGSYGKPTCSCGQNNCDGNSPYCG